MKQTLMKSTASGALLVFAPSVAMADMYGNVFTGINWIDDAGNFSGSFSASATTYATSTPTASVYVFGYGSLFASGTASIDTDSDSGFVIGGAIGKDFGNGFRLEGEFAWRQNDFDVRGGVAGSFAGYLGFSVTDGSTTLTSFTTTQSITGTFAGGSLGGDGEFNAASLMVNAAYDFENDSKFTPSVMAGIGMSWLDYKAKVRAVLPAAGTFTSLYSGSTAYIGSAVSVAETNIDEDDTSFAWQVGAGLDYAMSDATSISVEYRYMDGGSIEIGGKDIDYKAQSLIFGFKSKF